MIKLIHLLNKILRIFNLYISYTVDDYLKRDNHSELRRYYNIGWKLRRITTNKRTYILPRIFIKYENPSWSAFVIEEYLTTELRRTYNDFQPFKTVDKHKEFIKILNKAVKSFYKND